MKTALTVFGSIVVILAVVGLSLAIIFDKTPDPQQLEYNNKTGKTVWVKYVDARYDCDGSDSVQMTALVEVASHSGIRLQPNAFDRAVKLCVYNALPPRMNK